MLIPISIHLDGAEMYSNSEFIVLSFSSIVATQCHVLDCKFPIMKIPHEAIRDPDLKERANRVMASYVAWNFAVLASGSGPQVGFYQEPLTGYRETLIGVEFMAGYRAACVGFKADLKARREAFGFWRNYSATYICERCSATQGSFACESCGS